MRRMLDARVHEEGGSVGKGGLFLSDFTRLITQADNTQKLHHNGLKRINLQTLQVNPFEFDKTGLVLVPPKQSK